MRDHMSVLIVTKISLVNMIGSDIWNYTIHPRNSNVRASSPMDGHGDATRNSHAKTH